MKNSLLSLIVCLNTILGYAQSSANYSLTTNTSGDLALDKNSNSIDLTSGATSLVAAGNDDVASSATNIGFDFWFMGTRYTQFSANSNGIMRLGSTTVSSTEYSIGIASQSLISPFALDMATAASTGYVKSKVVGTAPNRCLVVEWKNMEISYSSTTANGTFQARLYESNSEIEFVYGTISYNTLPASGSRLVYTGFSSNSTSNTYATITSSTDAVSTTGGITSNDYGASGYPKTPTNLTSGKRYLFTPSGVNAPSYLVVSCNSGTSANLSWTDNASNESGFIIYYSTSSPVSLSSTYWTTVAANTTSNNVTGLVAGTTYYYAVMAYREGITPMITNSSTCQNPPSAPTLYNTSAAGASVQTSFNHCRNNDLTPVFTFAATHTSSYNTIQIELNTKSDFSGTSYKQSFSGTYSSATKYDLTCTNLDNGGLPNSEGVYYIRARASADGGTQWSSYTSGNWLYTYATTELGYHFTTKDQFDLGSLVTSSYGNFISSNNNGTTNNLTDDYIELAEGSSLNTVSGADQWLEENGSNYSGGSENCITVGYYNPMSDQDWHGFRFQSADIPQGATILSAAFKPFAHSGSGCGGSANTTNQLILKLRGADVDNCAAWASGSNTSTGSPRYRTRTTAALDWDIPSGASQQWSTGLEITTAPDITSIIQEIVDRPGYSAGNAIGIIVDHDGATGAYWRYFATTTADPSYAAKLQTTFTNFTNDIKFPNIPLTNFANNGGSVSWDKLYFDVDKASCGSCDVTFYVYNATGPTLITSGNTSPLNISGAGTAANIYVVARIKRNSSPKLNSFTVTVANGILPVKLNTFDLECNVVDAKFKWETESELNNKGFIIEASEDGKNYISISPLIKGNGTKSTTSKYNFNTNKLDISPYKYFRLKQIDFDGRSEYTPVLYNNCYGGPSKNVNINLYPNPASEKISIEFDEYLQTQELINIKVYDALGREVIKENINGKVNPILNIDTQKLNSGVYLVQVTGGIYYSSRSFLKE